MRTTLDIDDDLLQAAKEIARRAHKTAGQVVSELLRQALTASRTGSDAPEPPAVYGFQPFRAEKGRVVTNDLIDQLRGEHTP